MRISWNSFKSIKTAFETKKASLYFTRITFDDFFAQACAKVKVCHFIIIFFSLFPFFFFLSFGYSCWPSTRLLLSSRISEKANTRQGIFCHEHAKDGKGKFSSKFFTKFQNGLVHISSSIKPIVLVWVSLERSHPAPQLEHKWYLSRSKVMTSQVGHMPRSLTGSLGRFRCQWVNINFTLDVSKTGMDLSTIKNIRRYFWPWDVKCVFGNYMKRKK